MSEMMAGRDTSVPWRVAGLVEFGTIVFVSSAMFQLHLNRVRLGIIHQILAGLKKSGHTGEDVSDKNWGCVCARQED